MEGCPPKADIERVPKWAKIFDPDEDKTTPPIEISGMEPLYRRMMNLIRFRIFFLI